MSLDLDRVEAIFASARAIGDPDRQAAFLDGACLDDPEIRARVDALLAAHQEAGSFLARPADVGITVDAPVPHEGPGGRIGPYKLLEQIGEGGMGVVWMAEQTAPMRRLVALKVVRAGLDSAQAVARFETERQALALMDHPNIARVLDAGTTDSGRPYFVMELVKGVPITKYCDERRLTPRERLELFIPVCQAVQHAHQKGIIHRDLKPSNVLIALYDGKPVPKVIDFGIAKATGQKLTERTLFTGFGVVVGTPEYMSPEQAELNQLDVDTRSDVYSLGVLLYELLTGTTPLERKQVDEGAVLEVLRIIREVEPPKPSTRLSTSAALASVAASRNTEPGRLARQVRGELDWMVMKCLEKDRNRRYDTASALADDVQRYLHDEPVLAGPPSLGYRLRRWLKLALPGLVVAFVVGMILLWGWWTIQKTMREHEAVQQVLKVESDLRQEAQRFFNERVLSAATWANGGPDGTTLRQALVAAERQIAPSFAGRPLHEAAVRDEFGRNYLRLGEPALAARHYRISLELRRRHHSGDAAFLEALGEFGRSILERNANDTLLITLEQLASALEAEKHWAEAEPLRREALELRTGTRYDRDSALARLGRNLLEQGQAADAEQVLDECLGIREKKSPHEWGTFEAKALLGAALLGQKKYADAEPLLLAGYRGMKFQEGLTLDEEGRRPLVETGEAIVALYEGWGKPERARQWRERLKKPIDKKR